MRIYVASSWRNEFQPAIVQALRDESHEVYDFRHPRPGDDGFSWGDVAEEWREWTAEEYIAGLKSPAAANGFRADMEALDRCEACVLVLPCGRSAHLELGYAVGKGKRAVIYIPPLDTEYGKRFEAELMYKMVDSITTSIKGINEALQVRTRW